jgi:hypothetical protein
LIENGFAQSVETADITPAALSALKLRPILGRLFLPEEDQAGGDPHQALIGYELWRTRLGRILRSWEKRSALRSPP